VPEEIGFEWVRDEQDVPSLSKLRYEERTLFIRQISEYGKVFIVEDKQILFQAQLASLADARSVNNVMGL
jgi:hypothetical protein